MRSACATDLLLENALYSVISPRGCASILWKDAAREREACEILRITAEDMLEMGVAEAIIEEPNGSAHNDLYKIAENIKEFLSDTIRENLQKILTFCLKQGTLSLEKSENITNSYILLNVISVLAPFIKN